MNSLKGVLDGIDYPIFGINTEFNQNRKKLTDLQVKLYGDNEPKSDQLDEYLKEFIAYHEIEIPILKILANDADVPNPPYYEEFIKTWNGDYEGLKRSDEEVVKSARDDELPLNEETLNKMVNELAKAMISPKTKAP